MIRHENTDHWVGWGPPNNRREGKTPALAGFSTYAPAHRTAWRGRGILIHNLMKQQLEQIIPPPTREAREGFSNQSIIDSLSLQEKSVLEAQLLNLLKNSLEVDTLVVDTLVYMGSSGAVPLIEKKLKTESNSFIFFSLGLSLYKLSGNEVVVGEMVRRLKTLTSKFEIISGLNCLAATRSKKAILAIQEFSNHPSSTVAVVAKNHLRDLKT